MSLPWCFHTKENLKPQLRLGYHLHFFFFFLLFYIICIEGVRMADKLQIGKAGQYKFSQIFGYKGAGEKVLEEDVISSIKFDQSGNFLSVGDKAGRVIIFEGQSQKKSQNFEYFTQFQSHAKEFDPLRSMQIQEEIISIQWMRNQGKYLKMITTNPRSIKLWKIYEKTQKKMTKSAGKDLMIPKMQIVDTSFGADVQKAFPCKHASPINSISLSKNEQYLISSDDTQLFLWSLQKPEKPYVPVNYLIPNQDDEPKETITCSQFHPTSDSLFVYAMNKGTMKMVDLRTSAGSSVTSFGDGSIPKNYIYQLLANFTSAKFIRGGKYIATRDCLTVKLWDVCNPKKPVSTVILNDGYKSKLCEMVESQNIFDRFQLNVSPDNGSLLTGSYNNCFHVLEGDGSANMQYQLSYKKNTQVKPISKGTSLGKVDYQTKTICGDFNAVNGLLAVASRNVFFTYSL